MTYPAKSVPVKSASTFIFKAVDETQAERPAFYYAVQLLGVSHRVGRTQSDMAFNGFIWQPLRAWVRAGSMLGGYCEEVLPQGSDATAVPEPGSVRMATRGPIYRRTCGHSLTSPFSS